MHLTEQAGLEHTLKRSVTSILMPLVSARAKTSFSMMSAICLTSCLVSCLKTMISSSLFRNSGLHSACSHQHVCPRQRGVHPCSGGCIRYATSHTQGSNHGSRSSAWPGCQIGKHTAAAGSGLSTVRRAHT